MEQSWRPFRQETPAVRAMEQAWREGVIPRSAYLASVNAERNRARWLAWAKSWLLVHGVALSLAGVLFFFAYNWSAMHRFEKFALVQGSLVIALLLAWRFKWRGLVGEAFLVTAAVLVGVFLAVFGQVYQAGADAWQLFFGWAALIFIWVLAANSAALWVLWVTVADLAIILNAEQVETIGELPGALLLGAMLPLGVLAAREVAAALGRDWLSSAWLRPLLLLAGLVMATVPAMAGIIDEGSSRGVEWLLGWLLLAGAAFAVYRWRFRDILALTLVVFDAAAVLLVLIAELLFSDHFADVSLMLFSFAILSVVAGAYYWLRHLATAIHHERSAEVSRANA